MLVRNLDALVGTASPQAVVGVVVNSVDTGDTIAVSYALDFCIDEYGDLLFIIDIDTLGFS